MCRQFLEKLLELIVKGYKEYIHTDRIHSFISSIFLGFGVFVLRNSWSDFLQVFQLYMSDSLVKTLILISSLVLILVFIAFIAFIQTLEKWYDLLLAVGFYAICDSFQIFGLYSILLTLFLLLLACIGQGMALENKKKDELSHNFWRSYLLLALLLCAAIGFQFLSNFFQSDSFPTQISLENAQLYQSNLAFIASYTDNFTANVSCEPSQRYLQNIVTSRQYLNCLLITNKTLTKLQVIYTNETGEQYRNDISYKGNHFWVWIPDNTAGVDIITFYPYNDTAILTLAHQINYNFLTNDQFNKQKELFLNFFLGFLGVLLISVPISVDAVRNIYNNSK